MKTFFRILVVASLCMMWTAVQAEEPKAGAVEQQQMPPMGKPAEMDKLLKLVGTWTADLQTRMDTSSPYVSAPCTMVFQEILDGCAMMTNVTTSFMGMPYKGVAITTYDREKKKWTQGWTDNVSAAQVLSEGVWEGNTLTLIGSSVSMGMPYMSKDVTVFVSDTEIDWSMYLSYDGGKTWGNILKAVYKKKSK